MSWLRQVFVGQFSDIEKHEWPKALLMSAFFFLIIATFWVLKPMKRSVIINYFGDAPLQLFGLSLAGAESEQLGKILNLVVVGFFMVLFTWLVRRVPRHYLVAVFGALFSVAFLLFSLVINDPSGASVWSFFVLGDMFNSVFVALFWAFTNDIVTPSESKRIYGIVGLGGVTGGFLGATIVQATVEEVGRARLLYLCVIPMVLVTFIAFIVQRLVSGREGLSASSPAAGDVSRETGSESERSLALEGARLVFRSRYLVSIVLILGCYELVSNVIDFQLATTVERQVAGALDKDAFFGLVGQVIGVGSILVQLLATGFVLSRFGIKGALSALPVAIGLTSSGFLLFPLLGFAAAMSASDNALNYSIQQSAKEALYVPTSPEITYKAKAFIDMFVQRFAKTFSVLLNLAWVSLAAFGVRWLSLVTLATLGLWALQIRFVGKVYRQKVRARQASEHP